MKREGTAKYCFSTTNGSRMDIWFISRQFFICRMLDDFGHEMEQTESRMDNVMKKMAKVLHMSTGELNLVSESLQ